MTIPVKITNEYLGDRKISVMVVSIDRGAGINGYDARTVVAKHILSSSESVTVYVHSTLELSVVGGDVNELDL